MQIEKIFKPDDEISCLKHCLMWIASSIITQRDYSSVCLRNSMLNLELFEGVPTHSKTTLNPFTSDFNNMPEKKIREIPPAHSPKKFRASHIFNRPGIPAISRSSWTWFPPINKDP